MELTYETADAELRSVIIDVIRNERFIKVLDDLDVYNWTDYNERVDFSKFYIDDEMETSIS